MSGMRREDRVPDWSGLSYTLMGEGLGCGEVIVGASVYRFARVRAGEEFMGAVEVMEVMEVWKAHSSYWKIAWLLDDYMAGTSEQ